MLKHFSAARLAFVGSLILLWVCLHLLVLGPSTTGPTGEPLIVHSGAALRAPLEEIAQAYEKETGQKIECRYNGSQTILTSLEVTGQGDIFLPADESYIDLAQKKDLLAEVLPVARMKVVGLVRQGLPGSIKTWKDLITPNVRLAQSNPDTAAIGKLTREHLSQTGQWNALKEQTTVFTPTVTEVANAVKTGSVDVGLVWDAIAFLYPSLTHVDLPELDPIVARVKAAIVKKTTRPTEALRFARFLAAKDKGLVIFQKHGFTEIEKGDTYAHTPELLLYGGAMVRPAIEKTLDEFEQREGVRLQRSYNGCGILVSQMKTGVRPDIYFACDPQFMAQVREWFEESAVISSNQLVIAVPKGNPRDLHTLRDLGQPNLRVGVGHEQKCALGAITKETFIRSGVYADVMKNVVVQHPTGDFLVNQLRTGALDTVVAYRSNTSPYDDIEGHPVTGIPCASPFQPVAVSKSTQYPNLAYRLIQTLQNPLSQQRFEKLGFRWEFKK